MLAKSDLKIPFIAVAVLSLIALLPMPYGYYTLLRICVSTCGGLTAYIDFNAGRKGVWVWLCIAVAIVFNPIVPVHLAREIWSVLNILVAGLFSFMAYMVFKKG
jgi:hypothetical protein